MTAAAIRPVSFAEILGAPNAGELLREYAAECSLPELAPFDPQVDTYAALERSGAFQCHGVYEDGVLGGFASPLTYVVPHYGRRIVTAESLFLAAEHRRGNVGIKLIGAVEDYGRAHGCVAALLSAPAGSKFERLLRMLKPYRHSNTVFIRSL